MSIASLGNRCLSLNLFTMGCLGNFILTFGAENMSSCIRAWTITSLDSLFLLLPFFGSINCTTSVIVLRTPWTVRMLVSTLRWIVIALSLRAAEVVMSEVVEQRSRTTASSCTVPSSEGMGAFMTGKKSCCSIMGFLSDLVRLVAAITNSSRFDGNFLCCVRVSPCRFWNSGLFCSFFRLVSGPGECGIWVSLTLVSISSYAAFIVGSTGVAPVRNFSLSSRNIFSVLPCCVENTFCSSGSSNSSIWSVLSVNGR